MTDRLAVDWLTSNWNVNYHFSEETTEHLLCECQAWAVLRHKVVGSPYLETGQLRELDLGSLAFLAEEINEKL